MYFSLARLTLDVVTFTNFRSRLKAKNLMYINQILHVLSCFIRTMESESWTMSL